VTKRHAGTLFILESMTMRVLLVEDDELIGSGVEAGLRQAGLAVDWARDGREAETALSLAEYDLLILDLGLPRLSGTDLLSELRARGNDWR
jgi:two-component system, OmpR family, response regulator QseB